MLSFGALLFIHAHTHMCTWSGEVVINQSGRAKGVTKTLTQVPCILTKFAHNIPHCTNNFGSLPFSECVCVCFVSCRVGECVCSHDYGLWTTECLTCRNKTVAHFNANMLYKISNSQVKAIFLSQLPPFYLLPYIHVFFVSFFCCIIVSRKWAHERTLGWNFGRFENQVKAQQKTKHQHVYVWDRRIQWANTILCNVLQIRP